MIDIKDLILNSYNDNIFNRMDIIVRYLYIENYYEKNDIGYYLYEKMQKIRKGEKYNLKKFKETIKSFELNGYDKNFPIKLFKNKMLRDGSHRIACSLYFGIDKIPIKYLSTNKYIEYSLKWFEKNNFSSDEIKIIQQKYNEIMFERNMFFIITLWPPIFEYFDDIEKDICKKYNILKTLNVKLNDENFEKFVRHQYEIDDIEKWKVDKKLEYMKQYKKEVRILYVDLGFPDFREKKKNKKLISIKAEQIKKEIRNKYKEKIDNYFHDIIIHIGDNYEHTKHIKQIL